MANNNDSINLKQFDTDCRNIYIFDDIDNMIALNIKKQIDNIVKQDNEVIEYNKAELEKLYGKEVESINFKKHIPEINIYLSTYGGSCYDGLQIFDAISALNKHCPVNIIVSGKCMSMGIVILLAVPYKNRFATENATFLIHQPSSMAFGKAADLEDATAETKRLTDIIYKIIVDNTDITQEDVEKNYNTKKDWILTSDEAKDLKLIYKVK